MNFIFFGIISRKNNRRYRRRRGSLHCDRSHRRERAKEQQRSAEHLRVAVMRDEGGARKSRRIIHSSDGQLN